MKKTLLELSFFGIIVSLFILEALTLTPSLKKEGKEVLKKPESFSPFQK